MNAITSFFPRALCGVTLAASFFAASPASAIVGYVNVPLPGPGGYSLVANALDNTQPFGNTIVNLFSGTIGTPFGSGGYVLKWSGSSYSTFMFDGYAWSDGAGNPVGPVTLAVGEGAVVYNLGPTLTNTFVGEVRGLNLTNDPFTRLPVTEPAPGIYLRGSVAPFSDSGFADIMGRAPQDGDAVLKLTTAGDPLLNVFASGVWSGGTPNLTVGESAFFDTTGNQFAGFNLPSSVVPEPATFAIAGLGLMSVALYRRRNRRG